MAQVVKVRLYNDGAFVRTIIPRDDAGHFQGPADVNGDGRARRAADVGCEALAAGIDPAWCRGIYDWNGRWTPSQTPVAETGDEAVALSRRIARRVGSNNGRKAPIVDFITPNGVGVNLKLASSAAHAAVRLTTQRSATIGATVPEIGTAPIFVLVVESARVDAHYTIDTAHLRWALIDAAASIRSAGGSIDGLLAANRGPGALRKGEILPRAYAQWVDTTCINGSFGINVRGPKPFREDPEWQTGTIDDLRRALLAL